MQREMDFHLSRSPELTLDSNRPAKLLHDAIGDREPEAASLALFLGGVEGLERVGHDIRGHPHALIENEKSRTRNAVDFSHVRDDVDAAAEQQTGSQNYHRKAGSTRLHHPRGRQL
jgi:hypothetical protein